MDKLNAVLNAILNSMITVSSTIMVMAGVMSSVRHALREDYNGMVKSFIMTLIGLAIIVGYPTVAAAVRAMWL